MSSVYLHCCRTRELGLETSIAHLDITCLSLDRTMIGKSYYNTRSDLCSTALHERRRCSVIDQGRPL